MSWGDSSGYHNADDLLQSLTSFFSFAFEDVIFELSPHNYYFEEMKMAKKPDGWSCGPYALSVITTFAAGKDSFPVDTVVTCDRQKLE